MHLVACISARCCVPRLDSILKHELVKALLFREAPESIKPFENPSSPLVQSFSSLAVTVALLDQKTAARILEGLLHGFGASVVWLQLRANSIQTALSHTKIQFPSHHPDYHPSSLRLTATLSAAW